MSKPARKPVPAEAGKAQAKTPPSAPVAEQGVAPAGKSLPPSSGKSGAKKGCRFAVADGFAQARATQIAEADDLGADRRDEAGPIAALVHAVRNGYGC